MAGLDPSLHAGHSLRAGFATTSVRLGKPDRAIEKDPSQERGHTRCVHPRGSMPPRKTGKPCARPPTRVIQQVPPSRARMGRTAAQSGLIVRSVLNSVRPLPTRSLRGCIVLAVGAGPVSRVLTPALAQALPTEQGGHVVTRDVTEDYVVWRAEGEGESCGRGWRRRTGRGGRSGRRRRRCWPGSSTRSRSSRGTASTVGAGR